MGELKIVPKKPENLNTEISFVQIIFYIFGKYQKYTHDISCSFRRLEKKLLNQDEMNKNIDTHVYAQSN